MGSVVDMAGEVQNLDTGTLKKQLEESFRSLQKNSTKLNRTSMEIGWDAAFIERHDGWQLFGYKHQHACRTALGISYSNWFRVLSIANCFPRLTKAEYLCMKLDSADVLGRQPEEVRYDQAMIELASKEPIEVFKVRFAPTPGESKDHPSTFEVTMLPEKKEAIEAGLRNFMSVNNIDNQSYALELIVAEYAQGPTIAGFLSKAIPEVTQSVKADGDLEDLRVIVLNFIQELGNLLLQGCGEERVA
jgi:hypothetical protein